MTEPLRQDVSAPPSPEQDSVAFEDPAYRAAVVDLLGAITYGEISAFERLADDAKLAVHLPDKLALAKMATVQFGHVEPLLERISALGADPIEAMAPFVKPFDVFHAATAPSDWLEGLVKAYVGDGIAKDFYREMSVFVDDDTREVMARALDDAGESDFVVGVVRDTLKTDRTASGRLALWGRRLLGEALSQAQAVAVERDAMSALLVGGGVDLAEVGQMFTRLTDNHSKRMTRLGLSA